MKLRSTSSVAAKMLAPEPSRPIRASGGRLDGVETQVTERCRPHPHLGAHGAAVDAGKLGRDEERRDPPAPAARAGRREHDAHVAHRSEGDVRLVTVESVAATGQRVGGGRHREGVRAGVGLRHRERTDERPVEQARHPPRLLLGGPVSLEHQLGAQHLTRERERQPVVGAAVPEPLEGEQRGGQ